MMRSLWTAASGMSAQQYNVDTVANNLANVNTVGYKQESVNFKTLLYENMTQPTGQANVPTAPPQVGHGVMVAGTSRNHAQGTIYETGNKTDLAIQGRGYFVVANGNEPAYTRDGTFRFAMVDDDSYALVTTEGHFVINTDGEPIIVDTMVSPQDIMVNEFGYITYVDEDGIVEELGQIQIVQFANREGLEAVGSNLYRATPASGNPILENEADGIVRSSIRSGALEASNVNIADEMVNLIVAQRAYEISSTAIKASDEMLQQANDLKRI